MKSVAEHVEILRAAVVLAVADGKITSSEQGLLRGLAGRVGIGNASLDALIERAQMDATLRDELFQRSMSDPNLTFELLAAAARLDGEISQEERELLIHMMDKLKIPTAQFSEIYRRGVDRADNLRKAKLK